MVLHRNKWKGYPQYFPAFYLESRGAAWDYALCFDAHRQPWTSHSPLIYLWWAPILIVVRTVWYFSILQSLKCTFFFFFWLHDVACRISVPRPGIKPMLPAWGTWSLNHWTTREVSKMYHFKCISLIRFNSEAIEHFLSSQRFPCTSFQLILKL